MRLALSGKFQESENQPSHLQMQDTKLRVATGFDMNILKWILHRVLSKHSYQYSQYFKKGTFRKRSICICMQNEKITNSKI